MAPDDDSGDRKIRDALVDEATRQQLESWFSLPSFSELEDRKPAVVDEEMVAARERREQATAAVDPALLGRIQFRTEVNPETLLVLDLDVEVHVDPNISRFDEAMVERVGVHADAREVEIPDELSDDLKECVPQALLRDLHRPETYFDKTFEVFDPIAEERVDASAAVAAALRESHALTIEPKSPLDESRELLADVRRVRRQKWPELFDSLQLANRKVPA